MFSPCVVEGEGLGIMPPPKGNGPFVLTSLKKKQQKPEVYKGTLNNF